ncbi:MAG: carbonic anhydrase [Gammaproteobacteria bacterium]|nr:MAG: carbonic anhydrase [Gammaproteobacteria bacterium]
MDEIKKLMQGFSRFRARYFDGQPDFYDQLARRGQSPGLMVVACCDSRVDPAIITDSNPGDLFVVRNVANLVPPCEMGGGYHGTSAALEFAVRSLHVMHIIVLGHSQCGGIQSLLQGIQAPQGDFIIPWMAIAEEACRKVNARHAHAPDAVRQRACEQAAIQVSLHNLLTFPWVRERVEQGALHLHGWYFDIDRGELLHYNDKTERFEEYAASL